MYFPNYFQCCFFFFLLGFSSTMCQFWKYILLDCLDRADVLRGDSRVLEHLLPFASTQRYSHKSHFLGQQLLTSSHLRAAQDSGWCLGPGAAHCPDPTLLHLAWLLLPQQGVRPGPGTGICPESAGAHLSAKASDSLPHWSY